MTSYFENLSICLVKSYLFVRKGFVRVRAGRGSINTTGVWHVRSPSARTASPDPPPSRPGPPTDFEGQKLHAISPQRCARKKWPAGPGLALGGPGPAWKARPDIFINSEARMKFLGKCPPAQKVAFRVDETIGCDNTIRKWWARLTSYFENLSIC